MEGDFTIRPDEGLRIGNPVNPWWTFPGSTPPPVPYADDHGRYMPGRDQPYAANKAQDFTTYFSSLGWHTARNIPVTDIDDSGRVNPYPLFRVEAKSRSESDKKASVDATVTSSKDLHCRGCHAKGKIAANDRLDWSQYKAAYHSSSEYSHCPPFVRTCSKEFHPPRFADAVDRNGMPSQDIFDQEYAALLNITGIHEFYDAVYNHDNMTGVLFQAGHENAGKTDGDAPSACTNCHGSMMNYDIASQVYTNPGQKHGDDAFYPNFSKSLHAFHGQLQLDPSDHGKILRDVTGRPLRWDSARGVNPNSLFPVVDSKGKKLPDDMNCQMCHSGHREQTYRDRHATAGLVCADCHGDMMAVGAEANKPKTGPEGFQKRVDWYDQPDCGSCHTGNGNKGRLATAGYFSDGVTRQAFDAADASAMSRKPETSRFAVRSADKTPVFYSNWLDADWSTRNSI
ncbi:MAG: hypothetical protein RIQ52_1994, partial [Pseudomonadota bacterium]